MLGAGIAWSSLHSLISVLVTEWLTAAYENLSILNIDERSAVSS